MNWRIHLTASALAACFALQGQSAELIGARAVLAKAAQRKPPEAEPEQNLDEKLRKDLKAFEESSGTLSAKDAAAGWLKLVDQWVVSTKKPSPADRATFRYGLTGTVQVTELLSALPGPETWQELGRQIEARPGETGKKGFRQLGLRLLAARLNGDAAGRNAVLQTFEKELEGLEGREKLGWQQSLSRVKSGTRGVSEKETETVMEDEIKRRSREKSDDEAAINQDELALPDLVTLLGSEKAESILRRVLVLPDTRVSVEVGDETRSLARKLALELSEKLLSPQWDLTKSLDGVALYEVLRKRFPGGRDSAWETMEADAWYLFGLIAANRTSDATKLVENRLVKADLGTIHLDPDLLAALDKAGHTRAVNKFLEELLGKKPELPLWDAFTMTASRLGEGLKVEELARKALKKDGLKPAQRRAYRGYLRQALLASDKVEEAVTLLREEMAETPGTADEDDDVAMLASFRSGSGGGGITLANLGRAVGRTEWIDEGFKAAFAEHKLTKERSGGLALIKALAEFGRLKEAEEIAVEEFARQEPKGIGQGRFSGDQSDNRQGILLALVDLYSKAGRHADVVALFEEAPWWGVADLAAIRANSGYRRGGGHSQGQPYIDLAKSLAELGRKDEARKILHAALDQQPDCDRCYEALLALDGAAALGRFDILFARDQFEERPLIWKAEWFRREKNYPEAEKFARQAIAIDPSDGEQGKGDRLRAYAVLAEIRAAQGDTKQAELFRGAVAAIRLSEKADDLHGLGLLKRAIALYEESLKLFADAYCIQSRLAIQMADLGLFDAAEAHYQKAYELMPDSFGRIESHCFGCERAFTGERAQGLADKVFTKLVRERPDKPQIHYLIGYLREQQGRYAEAVKSLKEVVRLDPDYLNAWVKLLEIGAHIAIAGEDHAAAVTALIRLDPLGKRRTVVLGSDSDLRQIHALLRKSAELKPKPVKQLFPLAASQKRIEEDERQTTPEMKSMMQFGHTAFMREREERTGNFSSMLQSEPTVSFAAELISGGRSSFY